MTSESPAIDASTTQRANVFISYAREDEEFVRRLHDALAADDRHVWVDRQELYPTETYMKVVRDAIDEADAFLFVLSPDSVASASCKEELDHAVAQNKRLVPVVRRTVKDATVPRQMRPIQWVFARQEDDFAAAVSKILRALDSDFGWVRKHTRLLAVTRDWERSGRRRTLLLRGDALREAEDWLAHGAGRDPAPTQPQMDFIHSSRRAVTWQRRGVGGVAVAVILTVSTLVAYLLLQRPLATSRNLARWADAQLNQDPELSVLLAKKAMEARSTPEAKLALRRALLESRLRVALRGHNDDVFSAQFSRDGSRAVTASLDGTARVWDASNGRVITILDPYPGPRKTILEGMWSAAFSPDRHGRWVVTAGTDGYVRVWDAASGRSIMPLVAKHQDAVRGATFSPDGRRVVSFSNDGTAGVWEVATGQARFFHHDRIVNSAVFHPHKNTQVLTASEDNTARIWNVRTGKEVARFRGPTTRELSLVSAAFSPNGRLVVTASADGTAQLWDAVRKVKLPPLRAGHTGSLTGAVFSPDGKRVLAGSRDGTVSVWGVKDRGLLTLHGHAAAVVSASFSPNGRRIVTASEDGTVRVWDATKVSEALVVLRGSSAPLSAQFDHTGQRVIASGRDDIAQIWDASQPSDHAAQLSTESGHTTAAFSPDGQRIVTSGLDRAHLWDGVGAPDGRWRRPLATLGGHKENTAVQATFSHAGNLLFTTSSDATLVAFDAHTGAPLYRPLPERSGASYKPELGDDGRSILNVADPGTDHPMTRVVELATGRVRYQFPRRAIGTSRNFRRVVVTDETDGSVHVRDLATDGHAVTLQGAHGAGGAFFSPDGTRLVTVGIEPARLWATNSGKSLALLSGSPAAIRTATFSHDGNLVVTTGDNNSAHVWATNDGHSVAVLNGHTSYVVQGAFSYDDELIATASFDSNVRIWDAVTGEAILTLPVGESRLTSVSFSPDGRRVLTATEDGSAQIFECEICASSANLLQLANHRATRGFTTAECQEYFNRSAC
jgi:WD40 repeat protein